MKKLLSLVFAIALCFLPALFAQEKSHIAGTWQLIIDTPHGVVKAPLEVHADGGKLTATLQTEEFGALAVTGSLEGEKVSFSLMAPDGSHTFGFSGTLAGTSMSGKTDFGGEWSASR